VVICLQQGADLHMAQQMPLPLTVSCFTKIQIGVTFLVPAHPGSLGNRAVKLVCVCVCVTMPSTEHFQHITSKTGSAAMKADMLWGSQSIFLSNKFRFSRFFISSYRLLHSYELVAWLSGRTSVSGRRTFPVLRSTCS